MRVVFFVLLLTVGSGHRSGLDGNNKRALKQTLQRIANSQTDLLLTTVDLIFLQVNELVANLTDRMTMFENRLLDVERRLSRMEELEASTVAYEGLHQVTETPIQEPEGLNIIISLIKGMNHLLVEKTDAIDQRLENLESEVSNNQWQVPQRPETGDGKNYPRPQYSSHATRGPPTESALHQTFSSTPTPFSATTSPTRTEQSDNFREQTESLTEKSDVDHVDHLVCNIQSLSTADSKMKSGSVFNTAVTTRKSIFDIFSSTPDTSFPASATTTQTPGATKITSITDKFVPTETAITSDDDPVDYFLFNTPSLNTADKINSGSVITTAATTRKSIFGIFSSTSDSSFPTSATTAHTPGATKSTSVTATPVSTETASTSGDDPVDPFLFNIPSHTPADKKINSGSVITTAATTNIAISDIFSLTPDTSFPTSATTAHTSGATKITSITDKLVPTETAITSADDPVDQFLFNIPSFTPADSKINPRSVIPTAATTSIAISDIISSTSDTSFPTSATTAHTPGATKITSIKDILVPTETAITSGDDPVDQFLFNIPSFTPTDSKINPRSDIPTSATTRVAISDILATTSDTSFPTSATTAHTPGDTKHTSVTATPVPTETESTSGNDPVDHLLFNILSPAPSDSKINSGSVIPTAATTRKSISDIFSSKPDTSFPTSTTSAHTPGGTKSTSVTTTPVVMETESVRNSPLTTTSSNLTTNSTTLPSDTTPEVVTQAKSSTAEPTTTKAIPKTCSEVWQSRVKEPGIRGPGNYLIDPDGVGGAEPFLAYCDEDFTVIRHRRAYLEIRVSNYEEPGSFVFRPKYSVSVEQLKALTTKSQFCDQYIKAVEDMINLYQDTPKPESFFRVAVAYWQTVIIYECRSAVLLQGAKNGGPVVKYGWLVSIDGEKMFNWGGAPTNSSLCACGVDGSCVRPGLACNCDGDLRIKLIDEGVLMDKSVLPITEVRLGDTGGRKEHGRLWLGSLRCFN